MKYFAAILATAFLAYAPVAMSCECQGKKSESCEAGRCGCSKGGSCEHKKSCHGDAKAETKGADTKATEKK